MICQTQRQCHHYKKNKWRRGTYATALVCST